MKYLISFYIVVLSFNTLALSNTKSAYRNPNETASKYIDVLHSKILTTDPNENILLLRGRYPTQVAATYAKTNLSPIKALPQNLNINELFTNIRDPRFIKSTPFDRRPSFLFPDDGCFARSEVMSQHIEKLYKFKPSKIFAFGDLEVETPNTPYGVVTWWYHVAPVIQYNGENYVFDPSIEAHAPLKVQEWISKMGPLEGNKAIKIAICDSNSYSPEELCENDSGYGIQNALEDQKHYFSLEWRRLIQLKRDPEMELKDSPPWK